MNDNCTLQVIGAGPAGMSLVLALCNRIAGGVGNADAEQQLLESMQVFEASAGLGGKMAHYRINANTSAHDVVRGIADGTPFVALRDAYLQHPLTQSGLIPLASIGELMLEPLARQMTEFLGDRLHCNVAVDRIEITPQGFDSYDACGQLLQHSRSLLLCCGAREVPLAQLDNYRDRWEGSGHFMLRDDVQGLPEGHGPIVIVGASHSAFSCVWRLLHDPLFSDFARDRDILLLQRRALVKLRCTPEFAAANGVEFDPVIDLCPISGMVFRNGGLRKDAKKLYLDIRDGREQRARILRMSDLSEHQALLDDAALILQATGFVSKLPRIESGGRQIEVGNPSQYGELHDLANNALIPGLYGMGLGFNILPDDAPGEVSFRGGLHGFQSYPLTIAPGIIDRLTARQALEKVI